MYYVFRYMYYHNYLIDLTTKSCLLLMTVSHSDID